METCAVCNKSLPINGWYDIEKVNGTEFRMHEECHINFKKPKMETTPNFVEGLYSNEVSPKAPDFILANQSIHVEKLTAWLQANKHLASEKGYLNITTKLSKGGKRYIEIDSYKPKTETPAVPEYPGEINPEDIPF